MTRTLFGNLARALLAIALLVAAPWAGAVAQTTTGGVRGFVRDEQGAPLASVQIVLRNPAIGQERGVLSTESGFYSVTGLRPAAYTLSVRRIGFHPIDREIRVQIGQTLTLDLTLTPAVTTLSTVVSIAAPPQETQTSEVATNVTREQIENLPNFERNFLDIARLAPGITATNVNNTDKVIAAGGQPASAVNVFIDGATYKNDVLKGGVVGQDASQGNPFPQGAVQEFRVITQNYKAEYQKASSAIITATTRSGSNDLELEAFAHGIGSSYVARDAFTADRGGPGSDYKRLQAGASIGAPLVRDKLFFFGTYELNFRDQPQNVFLGGLAAEMPPELNLDEFEGTFTSEFRQHLGFGKLTWLQSDRSTVEGSVNIRREEDFRDFGGQRSFETAENVAIDVYTGVANWRYAGDRWLNEAQVNLQEFVWNPRPLNENLIGRDYEGLLRIGGRDSRQEFTQRRLSLRNDVTRSNVSLAGDHVFKAGVTVDFLTYEAEKFQNINPIFKFREAENWARTYRAEFGFGDPTINSSNTQFGGYVQDDWTVTPRLVLNLGLRWDAETNMINNSYVTPQPLADSLRALSDQFFVDRPFLRPDGTCCLTEQVRVVDELGGIERYITSGRDDRPVYLRAFQPRLGASFDVFGNSRTVLFGGWGIYYDRNYWNTLFDEQFRRQFKVLAVEFRDDCSLPDSPPNCVVWDERYFDVDELRSLSGTSGLPEVFLVANDLKPPRSQQMTLGVRQAIGRAQLTVSYNGVRGKNGMNFVRATPWGGLGPNYSTAFVADDRVRTWYDALQLQIERPLLLDSWWGGAIAYTLAKSEEQGQSTDIFWPFDDRFPTVGDLPRRRAPGDQRHAIIANGIFRLPADIRLSTIMSFGSGVVVNATDASRGWDLALQRTYTFEPPTRPFLGIGHVFATQAVDVALEKGLSLASGQRVSLRADLFNAFNNANYGCYDATIFPTSGSPNANLGKPGCAGLRRRLQVGLRYGFDANRRSGLD